MSEANTPTLSATQQLYHEACRELGLKKWDSAADKLTAVLEQLEDEAHATTPEQQQQQPNGKANASQGGSDNKPPPASQAFRLAPILHQYGHALLNVAMANSGALGGAPPPAAPTAAGASKSEEAPVDSARFQFGGDEEEEDADEPENAGDKPHASEEDQEEDQDDLALAFDVLDSARVNYDELLSTLTPDQSSGVVLTTYDGKQWDRLDVYLQLSEVLSDLGDLGLETEDFTRAAADYHASLEVVENPTKLGLPQYHRLVAHGRLRTALALEYHPDANERNKAIELIKGALNALQRRKIELDKYAKTLADKPDTQDHLPGTQARFDDITSLRTLTHMEAEAKEVTELIGDLELKLSETKAETSGASGFPMGTKEALEKTIQETFLGASTNSVAPSASKPFGGAPSDQPVNDLSARVKRRKTDNSRPAESGTPSTGSTPAAQKEEKPTAATGEKREAESEPQA